MIVIIYGTTGEIIKLTPLIKALPRTQYFLINTAQQPEKLDEYRKSLKIPSADLVLADGYRGQDLAKFYQIIPWALRVWWGFGRNYRFLRRQFKTDKTKPLVIVHGDTLTTVFGALFGRLLGVRVAHVEAGLRSFNWRHPFPEELDRLAASKLAHIHFAPGDIPLKNLDHTTGEKINTIFNTVLDSLKIPSLKPKLEEGTRLPPKFGLVSIHRNELLVRKELLRNLLAILAQHSKKIPLVFIGHPLTMSTLSALKQLTIFNRQAFILVPKQDYLSFIGLLKKAQFVVTDSGGLQEECAYLNVPCLVHRKATERMDGLGQNVVLSKYNEQVLKQFLAQPNKYRLKGKRVNTSPTKIIIDYLCDNGYL